MKIQMIDFGLPYDRKPHRSHYNDAGADVYLLNDYTLKGGDTKTIPLGFGLKIPDGYTGFIFSRSSLSAKGIVCELPPIDSGYRGEIHAVVTNCGKNEVTLKDGDRIGQLVILPVVLADFVTCLGDKRETAGFGSTGR